jgi:hypothetical protein
MIEPELAYNIWGKEVGMKDIITMILTDESARGDAVVEDALMRQAAAIPWASEA